MSRIACFLALAGLLWACHTSSAQESNPESRGTGAARLIQLLDSDDFGTREQATRDLMLLGDAGREALVRARGTGSLERQVRIAQVLQGLTARSQSRPARTEPSRVTIDADKKRLSEVAAMLAAQTGYPVRTVPGLDPVVSLSVQGVPFFEAVDLACAQAGARFGWDMKHQALVFEPSAERPGPVAYAGPLRVSLTMLTVNRTIKFGAGAIPAPTNLQIRIDAEERSEALGVMMPIRAKEILDDQKRSLRYPEANLGQSYSARFDQRRQLVSYVLMTAPEADAKAIARLELALSVFMPTELYEAELASPDVGSEAGQGAFHVTVHQWKEEGGKRQVQILVNRPILSSGVIANMSLMEDTVTFVGADGTTIQPETAQPIPSASDLRYTATLPSTPAVALMRITCLKQTETVEFPFVFENVPLQ
jgi:hypothetical protein